MFTHSIPTGRRRTLDRKKKQLFCDTVARGATMTEAAIALGVSLRTVQREARRDPAFDEQLRASHHHPSADPLTLMKSHARRHWRATAWLLERERPDQFGRRPASSCSPAHFHQELRTVLEAALEFTPAELRSAMFEHVNAACEAAFKRVFPTLAPGGNLQRLRPATPIADVEQLVSIRSGHCPQVFDYLEHEPDSPAEPDAPARAPSDIPNVDAQSSPRPTCIEPGVATHNDAPLQHDTRPPAGSVDRPRQPTLRLSHRYPLRAAATLNQLDIHPDRNAPSLADHFLSLLSRPTDSDRPSDTSPTPPPEPSDPRPTRRKC